MKKLLLAALLVPVLAAAGDRTIAIKDIDNSRQATVFVKSFCEFGFQFMVVTQQKSNSNGSGGISVIQVMHHDGSSLKPLPCQDPGK